MKPKAVNDLITNTVQGIILSLIEKPIKPTYLGYVKESHCCNFYFKFLEQKGCKGGISTFGMDEIGIDLTPQEASAKLITPST